MTLMDTAGTREGSAHAGSPDERSYSFITPLFAVTAFLGAALLFVVQPLVARMVLPSYGGSATVWSTSSLFFQTILLFAYWYVHWSTRRFGRQWQPRTQVLLLVLPLLFLPLALPSDAAPPSETSPILWLLRALVLLVGVPFGVLATTGPLLQRWYSWTSGERAEDPYFLYAASNFGSFVGLLAYPLLIEPRMTLQDQQHMWSWGFIAFVLLAVVCAGAANKATAEPNLISREESPAADGTVVRPSRRRLLAWGGLAFMPSALMLAVTSHLSTDVASIPLLWVVPLAIYLATYIVAFGRKSRSQPILPSRLAVSISIVALVLSHLHASLGLIFAVDLLMLTLVAYACHARLAADRPSAEHLTIFYLVIAVGGALGGLLNGLIAPVAFDRVFEFALLTAATPLLLLGLRQREPSTTSQTIAGKWLGVGLGVLTLTVASLIALVAVAGGSTDALLFLLILCLGASTLRLSRAPALLMILTTTLLLLSAFSDVTSTVHRERTFYGSYDVQTAGSSHVLRHGTTIHGTQFLDPDRRSLPTTYYSEQGPLGDLFAELDKGRFDNVGAIGLGTGTIAAYGRPGQVITFFEIDQAMVRTASDPTLFSYLHDSKAQIKTVIGDGRLKLAEEPAGSFDLLILDAFSSDSIPVHLLTSEAMRLYADRLGSEGVIAVHISNRVFDLEPVVAGGLHEIGWAAAVQHSSGGEEGATPSSWVIASRDDSSIETLLRLDDWRELAPRTVTWTDDYSSVLAALR